MTRRRLVLIALLAAAAIGIYASGVLDDIPDAETVIEDIAQGLGQWTYLVVGVLAFLETGAFVGLVAPGETVVIAGGVIAGQGEISLTVLIGLVWACAFLGDSTSFFIGRRLGRGFILRHGPRVRITEERLEQVEGFFQRHGGKTILIGRFVGLVRALAPFIAGSSGLRYGRFAPYSIVGTGLWATLFCVLGYVFYASFDRVAHAAGRATFAFGVTVAVIAGAVYAWRRLRDEEERRRLAAWVERQSRRPLVRPLAAVVRPLWRRALRPAWRAAAPRLRFLWQRLTPGELGLELTTALAFAGVGLYVFVLYTVILSGDIGPTPLDTELRDLARDLHASMAVDVIEVVTDLGSFPVFAALVLVTAVVLAVNHRPIALGTLVIGAVLVYLAVHATKAGIDRPRPEGSLVETSGSAFPSGHAAYSTAWVMVAAIAAWNMPSLLRNTAVVGIAFAIVAAVGLSRIYLGAHWWSDVAGGWGLGFGVFGACSAVALVVAHIRQNEMRPEP
jgi:membrane protein DedA with SNARE-associated domain/membrane-associated phospholipid phosphatase